MASLGKRGWIRFADQPAGIRGSGFPLARGSLKLCSATRGLSSADEPPGLILQTPAASAFSVIPRADCEHVPLWAGESVGLVGEIEPAGEIVRRIARKQTR
jgi:hypothetical protein